MAGYAQAGETTLQAPFWRPILEAMLRFGAFGIMGRP